MPTMNFHRVDLDLIYPPFLERVLNAVAACEARGVTFIATHGYRTYGAQMALWAQGRTALGPRVTNAMGGQSAHNFGLAIDFVRDIDRSKAGVQPSWEPKDYAILIEECEKRGLHSGKGYKDWPHIGWPGYVDARDCLSLDMVWQTTDAKLGTLDRLKTVWLNVRNPPLDPQALVE